MNNVIKNKIKDNGQIYTPDFIVKNMLDFSGYYGPSILGKNIIDNSCGNGAFLVEIVKRYCKEFYKKYNKNNVDLKKQLERYIHGIEIQENEIKECILNLNELVEKYELRNVNWDLNCSNTLLVDKYNGKMDFVVGNPPYVRVHNLKENFKKVKEFLFSQNGMTDLYIVFFEISLKMLNEKGKMCLITPSSFLRSNAGNELRNYIYKNMNLTKIVDLEHFQPFNATTYTIISLIENNKNSNEIEYFIFDEKTKEPKKIENLEYSDVFVGGKMYFSTKKDLKLLHDIESCNNKEISIEIKNGFATLADKIFINKFDFTKNTINILKASNGKWHKCIYPYNENGNAISIKELKENSKLYDYLLGNKDLLDKRSSDDKWYLFGRSQGLKDVSKNKIAINTIIKDINSIRLESVPSGSGVYSGLYILTTVPFSKISDSIKNIEFIKYIKLLKNYKSGGYYTYSSGELKKYLNYKLTK